MKQYARWLSLAVLASLSACNGSSSTLPSSTVACAVPAGTQFALSYPVSGGTGVPDAPQQIVVAASPALPASWDVVVNNSTNPSGGALGATFQTITYGQVPTPNTPAPFANPVYQSSALGGGLPSGQVITVFLNDTGSSCTPFAIGSFTTQ